MRERVYRREFARWVIPQGLGDCAYRALDAFQLEVPRNAKGVTGKPSV